MQQHPVPQNVTQYQFRLVGDMTLKQFLELLGGIILAYLFYASNLIFIFKWPLALFSVFLGIALAFFPIEDRPLDQWVTNFIKSIYQPTRFIWKKTSKIPSVFSYTPAPPDQVVVATKTIKAPSLPTQTTPTSDLSANESARLSSLDSLFSQQPIQSNITPQPSVDQKPTVSIRKLGSSSTQASVRATFTVAPIQPISTPAPATSPTVPAANTIIFAQPKVVAHAPAPAQPAKTVELPATPKLPNLVTGVVVDKDGKLIDSAIVQIIDSTGLPARALKTNALGRFFTSTPLSPGTYTVETEKTGLTFSPQSLSINNSILPAIELRASN